MPSNYFSRLRGAVWQGVWRSIYGQETGIEGQVGVLIGQGKLLLGHSRLLHSIPSETISNLHVFVQPGTLVAAQANLHLANRRKNISVVGVFSRAISVPSVSGPSFQVLGYHTDCMLSETCQVVGNNSQKALMAVCGCRSPLPDCSIDNLTFRHAQPGVAANRSFSTYRRSSLEHYRKATMSLRNKEQPNNFLLYGYFIYNVFKRKGNDNPFLAFGFEDSHVSSPAYSSAGIAPDVSFDNSMKDEQQSSSADSSEQNVPANRTLKLKSGSCYLPHPDKEETGGEDAHFICTNEQAIGVADGVGGWADLGVDAGQYARELMSNSVCAIQEEPRGSVDPARVLEKAYISTKAKGSSTACIIALTDQGLQAINLGDSGFLVVREGCTVFRSPVQQHDFNFTYQLECGNAGDLPSSGQVFTIPVAPGDVIIAGTDGLFDNLYNSDITAIVVHAMRAGLGPQVTAQKVAALARQRAQDKNRQTPFSAAAQEAGFRYYGGKLDDITVVVSYITSDQNVIRSERRQGWIRPQRALNGSKGPALCGGYSAPCPHILSEGAVGKSSITLANSKIKPKLEKLTEWVVLMVVFDNAIVELRKSNDISVYRRVPDEAVDNIRKMVGITGLEVPNLDGVALVCGFRCRYSAPAESKMVVIMTAYGFLILAL